MSSHLYVHPACVTPVDAEQKRCADVLNNFLRKRGETRYHLLTVLYDDTDRKHGTIFGENITDVKLALLYKSPLNIPPRLRTVFHIAPCNVDGAHVLVPLRCIRAVLSDSDGSNLRAASPDTGAAYNLADILRDIDEYAPDKVATGTNLLLDPDERCLFSVQAALIPYGEDINLSLLAHNYQSTKDVHKNVTLVCHPKGIAVNGDATPLGVFRQYGMELKTDSQMTMHHFKISDGGDIGDVGKQTKEAASKLLAEKKSIEVPLGPEGAPKSCAYMFVQRPVSVKPPTRLLSSEPSFVGWTMVNNADDTCTDVMLDEEEKPTCMDVLSDDDEKPTYSNLAAKVEIDDMDEEEEDKPPCVHYRSAPPPSMSAGVTDVGDAIGPAATDLQSLSLTPTAQGITTVRYTLPILCRGQPTPEDATKAVDLLNRVMNAAIACAGAEATSRFGPAAIAAGATSTAPLSKASVAAIAASSEALLDSIQFPSDDITD